MIRHDEAPATAVDLAAWVDKARQHAPDRIPVNYAATLAKLGATPTAARAKLFEMMMADPLGLANMRRQLQALAGSSAAAEAPDARATMRAELARAGIETKDLG